MVHRARQDEARAGEGDLDDEQARSLLVALLLVLPAPRSPSGGADVRLEPAPINRLDVASLQRGARNFVNYCLNCHSAKYMRYNRLTDLGLTEAQIQRQPDVRRPTRSARR